jgi:hypothetical protein
MRCTVPETSLFDLVIESPSRGRVSIGVVGAKKALVTTLVRAGYESFGIGYGPPWTDAASAPLSIGMSYDAIAAYEEARGNKFVPGCSLGTAMPQGYCSHGSTTDVSAFVAANTAFERAPPDGFYELVRQLVAARAKSYAATDLRNVGPGQLQAWAADLSGYDSPVDEKYLSLVGNQEGRLAAGTLTDDGGFVYAGIRTDFPVVVKVDAHAKKLWELTIPEAGWHECDGASIAATKSSLFVQSTAHRDNGKGMHRVVKLDAHGKLLWKWYPQNVHRPQISGGRVTPADGIVLTGYIQTEPDGPVHDWTAEVDANGKSVREEVGPIQPPKPSI